MGFQRHRDEPDIVFLDGARPVASDPDLVDVELTYALGRAYIIRRSHPDGLPQSVPIVTPPCNPIHDQEAFRRDKRPRG